jgi:predicted ATPase/DNA-binding SARP family transcriptional activator/predicted negative regulator of RcsB-dependent stress response
MQHLEIALLGPPNITIDGKPFTTDRHKAIGLLAYLAVEVKSHSRETLSALLWPEYSRGSAFSYLRRTLWELNQSIGKGWIVSDRERVSLARLPGMKLDIDAFQRALADDTDQIHTLAEAVSLYRGDFLEGMVVADTAPFEEWQLQKAEYYRLEFSKLLERLVKAYERLGEYEDALRFSQRWLALDRLDEIAYRSMMRLLAENGDRRGAIRVYQSCVETLKKELDITPQNETEQLYQAIIQSEKLEDFHSRGVLQTTFSKTKPAENLPCLTTAFIERRAEIDQILKLALDQNVHLLTLIGPGGNGKTRLSIQAAEEMAGHFPDGVWFIPLAPVESAQGLIPAIASGLSFSFYKGEEPQRQQLLNYLREKKMLLVLDNFEHLAEAGKLLVVEILGAAKNVKVLVTSRERLNLQAEQVYRVAGMQIPDQRIMTGWEHPEEKAKSYSAIQLLIERARRVNPDFLLTPANLCAVTEICRLVDGSPLGIELAGAWFEMLSAEEIVSELSHSLDFLESRTADIPVRQRSLRAVFNTSWMLLNVEEQQAISHLCVFRGSFSKQAALSVSGSTMQTLLSLINKSWIAQLENGRFLLHEVLRQYGLEDLEADQKEWQDTRDCHADFFCTLVQLQGMALRTANQVQALQALKTELEGSIQQAWMWCVLSDRVDVIIEKMLPGLFHYALIRGATEDFIAMLKYAGKAVSGFDGREKLLQQAILETLETTFEMNLFLLDDHPKERLEQLWARIQEYRLDEEMGFWYIVLIATYTSSVNYEQGSQHYLEIMPKVINAEHAWDLGYIYLLASQSIEINQYDQRKRFLTDALAIFKEIGVVHEVGIVLQVLGGLAASERDYQLAIKYTLEAQSYLDPVGDEFGVEGTWINLGEYYIFLGEIDRAFQAFDESRRFNEKTGNRRRLGTDLSWESLQASRYGRLEYALELRKQSMKIAIEVDNQNDIAWATWEMGEIYRLMGDFEQAKRYYNEAQPLFKKMHELIGLGFFHRGYGDIAITQEDWNEAREQYEQALAFLEMEKRRNRVWGLALIHAKLGTIFVRLHSFDEAKQHFKSSLFFAQQWHTPDLYALPLVGIAALLASTGNQDEAIKVAACVANQATTWDEIKKQAEIILQDQQKKVEAKEWKQASERGEKQDYHELCTHYLESQILY